MWTDITKLYKKLVVLPGNHFTHLVTIGTYERRRLDVKLGGFDFEGPYTSADEIREEAGVYVVLSLRPERSPVLDVGESGWNWPRGQGMRSRLKSHERRSCWEEHRGDGYIAFVVLYEPDGDRRLKVEKALRRSHHPPCGRGPPIRK